MIHPTPKFAALILAAFALLGGDDPKPEPTEHEGTWQAVSFEREGKATPEDVVRTITREVAGDHVVWKRSGKSFAGTSLSVDASADPKTLDVVPDGGPSRDKIARGIYKIEGDVLTICMGDPGEERPRDFSAPGGSRRTLITFRKAAKAPKTRANPARTPGKPSA